MLASFERGFMYCSLFMLFMNTYEEALDGFVALVS